MTKKISTPRRVNDDNYVVETLTDNDYVHIHCGASNDDMRPWFGDLLIADEPTSLVAHSEFGMLDIATRHIKRAEISFEGPQCFDCNRRMKRS